jgi:Big-like domain-containing protein/VCBS repeat protein
MSDIIIGIFKGNGDGTFKTPLNYGAGYTVSMGDFDGNGTVDLVSASELDSEIFAGDFGIAVVPGNGDGTFQARTELVKVASTQSQTTGDVNGDGKPDIVGTNSYNNTVSVYLNDGDGNFPSWTDYPTGTDPEGVVIGDVNGDGIPDLVVADHADNLISVLLGNGDGTFQPRRDFATATSPKAILLSDFNNDGITDVATANQTNPGTVSILLGAGDGTFPTHHELSAGDSPQSIANSDFNGDGKTDLVVNYNYAGGISDSGASVFLSNGDGTFQPRVDYSIDLYDSHGVAAGDINSDGKPDLIVSNYVTVSVFLGNGDGTFQPHVDYPTGGSRQLFIGDFNGDGSPDIVTGTGEIFVDFGKISLLLGNGDGTFQPYSQYLAGPPSSFSAADLNDDGALDLVVSNVYDPSISIFFNLGGSRVSLISSENPSHAGDPVTFTATVTPTFGLATPSGVVRFFDGSNSLGTGVLDGKEATLTLSTLTNGNHQIRAKYFGDSTFVPARSKKLTQQVRP